MIDKKLTLEEWINAFNKLDNPLKKDTIRKLCNKHQGKESKLKEILRDKMIKEMLNRPGHIFYVQKYLNERRKEKYGGTLSYTPRGLTELLTFERDISENLYFKISEKQDEVEKFILGDSETKDNGRFIHIKRATEDSFYDFMKYINNYIAEYMKAKNLKENPIFKKNIKGRSTKDKEENLNETITLINELLYLHDKNRKKIEQIRLKDFRDLKKELLENIKKLDIKFCPYPNNLTSYINGINEILEKESEFIKEQVQLQKERKETYI